MCIESAPNSTLDLSPEDTLSLCVVSLRIIDESIKTYEDFLNNQATIYAILEQIEDTLDN